MTPQELRDAIRRVKPALAVKDYVQSQTFFLVRDGRIHAQNGVSHASTNCPIEGTFLVSGSEFERAVNKLPADKLAVVQDEKSITVKGGRYRTRIETLPSDQFLDEVPNVDEVSFDKDKLLYTIKELRPFVRENAPRPFVRCISFSNGKASATNNIVLLECLDSGLETDTTFMLPYWAADYIIGASNHGELTNVFVGEGAARFAWDDGTVFQTSLGAHPWPDSARDYLNRVQSVGDEITDEWRESLLSTLDLGEDNLTIYGDRMEVGRGRSRTVIYIDSPVPADHDHSTWSIETIVPVVKKATHINIANWPKPATFQWDNIKGLIASRKDQGQ